MATPGPEQTMLLPPWITCPGCRSPRVLVIPRLFSAYFGGVEVTCPDCSTPLDWWDTVLQAIREHFMLTGAFHVLGAMDTVFKAKLARDKATEIDFVGHGVPENAAVLSINYTGFGELRPVELHGNVPRHDPVRKRVSVYGASHGKDVNEGRVFIAVTWIAPDEDEVSLWHLIDAARAYDAGRYDAVIVPANIAVESALAPALHDYVSGFCSKDRAKQFLDDAVTYSHQLNVLLPIVCHMIGLRGFPDHIRGILNRLRGLRNDVVHRGRPEVHPTKDEAAEFLTAAVFGYHYSRLLHAEIRRARSNGRIPA